MLVLSRRESEKILLPELGITLEIVSIKGNSVRVGIDAPREIRVIRGELEDREPTAWSSEYSRNETQPSVRESRTGYQIQRKAADLAADSAMDIAGNKIAC